MKSQMVVVARMTQGGDEDQTLHCGRQGCNTNTLWFHELPEIETYTDLPIALKLNDVFD